MDDLTTAQERVTLRREHHAEPAPPNAAADYLCVVCDMPHPCTVRRLFDERRKLLRELGIWQHVFAGDFGPEARLVEVADKAVEDLFAELRMANAEIWAAKSSH